MSFNDQLRLFLTQSQTNSQVTKHYIKEFQGLEIKVSFGKGNPAKIPWIAFLQDSNTPSNGIYPVYLLFKEFNLLVLAYGISETIKPKEKWNVGNKQTIDSYFKDKYSKKPERYGESLIFKIYDTQNLPLDTILDEDLNSIIKQYLKQKKATINREAQNTQDVLKINIFYNHLKNTGLLYSKKLITRFVASLLTKPFVILTGLSGSGKTKLAQAFVQWICENDEQYKIIPVGADWTNREPLLGYPNALQPDEYVKPESGVLDLIILANSKPDFPFFLILDEMNLSHVERYFADFLSVMESKEAIPLHAGIEDKNGIPSKLHLPSNLFIIGTVNIDETTNMFSPKVLDRANTIEFRVTEQEMMNFLNNIGDVNLDSITGKGATMANDFLGKSKNRSFISHDKETINSVLNKFFKELRKAGAEFGYRSATEIIRLINQLEVISKDLSLNEKIDIAIIQKLLPKLHGSRRKLSPVLEILGTLCTSNNIMIVKDVFENTNFDFNRPDVLFPLSLEKITRMYIEAHDNRFASFAEA